eukprot:3426881-Amphidinium_carterae.1
MMVVAALGSRLSCSGMQAYHHDFLSTTASACSIAPTCKVMLAMMWKPKRGQRHTYARVLLHCKDSAVMRTSPPSERAERTKVAGSLAILSADA